MAERPELYSIYLIHMHVASQRKKADKSKTGRRQRQGQKAQQRSRIPQTLNTRIKGCNIWQWLQRQTCTRVGNIQTKYTTGALYTNLCFLASSLLPWPGNRCPIRHNGGSTNLLVSWEIKVACFFKKTTAILAWICVHLSIVLDGLH